MLKLVAVTARDRADQARADAWVGDNLYGPVGVGLPGPLTVQMENSWKGYADVHDQTIVPGTYEFVLRCQDNLGTVFYEEWSGGVQFTSPTKWKRLPVQQPTSSPGVTSAPATPEDTATAEPDGTPSSSVGSPSQSAPEVSSHADADDDDPTSVAGSLAATGAGVTGLAALAGFLLAGGAGLTLLSRRRRRGSTTGPMGR